MITLLINPGSTSRKFALYTDEQPAAVVHLEMEGEEFSVCLERAGVREKRQVIAAAEYQNALTLALESLQTAEVLKNLGEIDAVGVRVVSPGSHFLKHQLVDQAYLDALAKQQFLAPLHIEPTIKDINDCQQTLADTPVYALSDSAFHSTQPLEHTTLSLKASDAEDLDMRRFGYHGLSVAAVVERARAFFPDFPARLLVVHVGGGISVSGVLDGQSVTNSMGYTPASGLIMGSRGGDITGGVVAALAQEKGLSPAGLFNYLYTETGFYGVCGARDLREVLNRAANHDTKAELALAMFATQIKAAIGAAIATLGGVDAVVVTATASIRNPKVRELTVGDLETFNILLDQEKNESLINVEGLIGTNDSIPVAVLRNDEFAQMLHELTQLLPGT